MPLLELYFAFPFLVDKPRFHYESTAAAVESLVDQIPGSNTDYYAVQHWADVSTEDWGVTMCSAEAPMMEFGGLWPGYVSGAHHRVTPPGYGHPFRKPGQPSSSHIYSYVMNNNFRTNFRNTQVGDLLFHYAVATHRGAWQPGEAQRFGWAFHHPLLPVRMKGPQEGLLPAATSFCRLEGADVLLCALKRAEDGGGIILRILELAGRHSEAVVTLAELPRLQITRACRTNLVEEEEGRLPFTSTSVSVMLRPFEAATVRLELEDQ
jgi:alpha-mannosidase